MLDLGDFQTMCILGLVKYVWRKSSENIWWWCHAVLDVPKSHCQEERNCRQANENGCQSICQEIQKLGNIKGESRVYIKCILHLGNVEWSDKPHFHLHPYNAGAPIFTAPWKHHYGCNLAPWTLKGATLQLWKYGCNKFVPLYQVHLFAP